MNWRFLWDKETLTQRELAIRMIEGNGVPQNQSKAVALLEDCVTLGDDDAMLMLANCCALGHGMEHDTERAESLISEAANKGNQEALCLMNIINEWKGQKSVNYGGLFLLRERELLNNLDVVSQGKLVVN